MRVSHSRNNSGTYLVNPKGSGEKVEVLHWILQHAINNVHTLGAPAIELPVGLDSRHHGGANLGDA